MINDWGQGTPRVHATNPPKTPLDMRGPVTRGGILKQELAVKMAMDAIDRFREFYSGEGTERAAWVKAAKASFEDNSIDREQGMSDAFASNFWNVFGAIGPGDPIDAIDRRPQTLIDNLVATFVFLYDRLP